MCSYKVVELNSNGKYLFCAKPNEKKENAHFVSKMTVFKWIYIIGKCYGALQISLHVAKQMGSESLFRLVLGHQYYQRVCKPSVFNV